MLVAAMMSHHTLLLAVALGSTATGKLRDDQRDAEAPHVTICTVVGALLVYGALGCTWLVRRVHVCTSLGMLQ